MNGSAARVRSDGAGADRAPRRARDLSLAHWALLLVALSVAAFSPAIRGGFIWDDGLWVTDNLTLRTLDGLRRVWLDPESNPQYYPLVHTSFWVEYHLWGLVPIGYHVVNVGLHAANAVLVWQILRHLELPGAWLAAALFAVHPVHVESVAWISERKNVLSGFFYLTALLAYLLAAGPPAARRWRYYLLALGLFVCALLSKTVTCSLPAAILLLWWWKRNRLTVSDVLPLIPFFALGLALGLNTAWLEKHQVGAAGEAWSLSLVERCLVAGRALWFYAGKLLWPHPLVFMYPRWTIDAGSPGQYLFPLGAVAVATALWWARPRLGNGPLAAVLFFAGTLLPALGFFDLYPMQYSWVADHFQYLASLGPITLAAAMATSLFAQRGARAERVARATAAAVLAVLVGRSWYQAHVYKDLETLWRDTIAKNPSAWMAHNNLGLLLKERGRLEDATAHYQEALRLRPEHAKAHNNLGIVRLEQGRLDEAMAFFREALRLDPELAEAHNNLGNALQRVQRIDEAITHYSAALRIHVDQAHVHFNLAGALASQRKFEDAVQQYREAHRLRPDWLLPLRNLSLLLAFMGRLDEAIDVGRKAGELAASSGNDALRQEIEQQVQRWQESASRSQ